MRIQLMRVLGTCRWWMLNSQQSCGRCLWATFMWSNVLRFKCYGVPHRREAETLLPSPYPYVSWGQCFLAGDWKGGQPICFPPFCMIAPLLAYCREREVQACSVVLPVSDRREGWWTMVSKHLVSSTILARKGDREVLWYPSKKGSA